MEIEILGDGRIGKLAAKVLADYGITVTPSRPSTGKHMLTGAGGWFQILHVPEGVEVKVEYDSDRGYIAQNINLPCGCGIRVEYDYYSGSGGQLYMRPGWACEKHKLR
jgi:hypothetical protein